MEIVLLEDVKTLGKKGDIVKASDGYARNFILPRKLGVEATPANLAKLKQQKAYEAKVAAQQLADAKALAENLAGKQLEMKAKVGKDGRLFGAISGKEIAQAAKDQLDLELDKKKLQLGEPIKALGMHTVSIKLHKDVLAELKINVTEE